MNIPAQDSRHGGYLQWIKNSAAKCGGILLVLTAIATALAFGPATLVSAATTACIPSLSFQTTAGNTANAGTMQYQLTALNLGSGTCTGTALSAYYADGETFVRATPAPTSGYYWNFGNLGAGKSSAITLTTDRNAPLTESDATDQACFSALNGADACASAPTAAPQQAKLPTPAPPAVQPPNTTGEYGIWEWTPADQMTNAEMQSAVNNAAAYHFNAIYLTVDDYLTIDQMPAGAAKQQALNAYEQSLNTFLSLASQQGIAIDAESGWRDWAEPGNTWQASDIMNFVAAYNNAHAVKFRGVQYDVEPYLLPAYTTAPGTVLTQYVALVESLVDQDQSLGLPLGFDVPSWYNAAIAWTPEVTNDGITAYPYDQMVRLLNELPNSRLIVMAYRNTASGANGTIAIAQPNVQATDGTRVKTIVAQETGNVTPNYVTFYGTSKSGMAAQVAVVTSTFSHDPSFGGIAVDYLDPFVALPN